MTQEKPDIKRYVFCDFDGTITAEETLEGVFNRFAPGLFAPVKAKMMALEISIRDGVKQVLESIPSSRYPEILEYAQQVPIRPGFEQLLDYLEDRGVPFVVVSGGLRGMVDARLGDLAKRVYKIFAAEVDTRGEYLKVISDYEGDTELVAKADIMNLIGDGERIAIGDGATDINMAKHASLVFARDGLAFFLDQMGISYKKWDDFFDVKRGIETLWES